MLSPIYDSPRPGNPVDRQNWSRQATAPATRQRGLDSRPSVRHASVAWTLALALGLFSATTTGCGGDSDSEGGAADASSSVDASGGSTADASTPVDAGGGCMAPDGGIGLPCTMAADCPCDGACAMGSCVAPLLCNEALLNWTGPTENEDGTCLTDLGGFKLYWSTTEMNWLTDQTEDLVLPCIDGETVACGMGSETVVQKLCSHRMTGLPNGTIYIGLTSYNQGGLESTPAGPVMKVVDCP